MEDQADEAARLERLRILAVVLPMAYLAATVGFLALTPAPHWATALVVLGVSLPLVVGFTAAVFSVVNTTRTELLRREELFRGLLESAPDGIVIVDAHGIIAMVNQQALLMFGYAADELVGRPVEILIPREMRDRHTGHREAYYADPAVRPMGSGLDLLALCKDGTRMPVEISLSPIAQREGLLTTAVIRDITTRRRLEGERERLRRETQAQRERERIAMDLHDGIIQSIYAVALRLESTLGDIGSEPVAVRHHLERSISDLEEVIGDIRSYIFDLRPPRIDGDVARSLENLAMEFRVNSLLETSLTVAPAIPPLDPDAAAAVYHVAREALSNVRKHARATAVKMSLGPVDGCLVLEVCDNGTGFDPGADADETHRGVRNMTARAAAAGGALAIEGAPGEGTRVRFKLPLQAEKGATK